MHNGRFLFFTNECVGLGHLRRTLTLAQAVADSDESSNSLIVTGSAVGMGSPASQRIDTVKLPSLARDPDGTKRARTLHIDADDVRAMRSSIALAVARSFEPGVAVIDKTPLGLGGELAPTLEWLKSSSCRLVLGLRDIEGNASAVRRAWLRPGIRAAIDRYFDCVLVYGPPSPFDAISCLGWDDIDVAVHHVGYLGAPVPDHGPADLPSPYLLVTVGGGVDGYPVAACVVDAVRLAPLPIPTVVVTGPLMPHSEVAALERRAEGLDVRVLDFRPDMASVVAGARAVVGMAGYNTVSEVRRSGKPALLVPRIAPSDEQLIRATSLAGAGVVDMLHPSVLTPARMREALDLLLDPGRRRPVSEDHNGLPAAVAVLTRLAAAQRAPGRVRLTLAGTTERKPEPSNGSSNRTGTTK